MATNKMGFYDLRNYIINPKYNKDKLIYKNPNIIKGIQIEIFNNFYYIFNFNNFNLAQVSKSIINIDDFNREINDITIHIQKEIINAFNGCVYIIQKTTLPPVAYFKTTRVLPMTIDSFFLPHKEFKYHLSFAQHLKDSLFSSQLYKTACDYIYNYNKKYDVTGNRLMAPITLPLIEKSLDLFRSMLREDEQEYHRMWFYIFGYFWKALYYKDHDLRMEAILMLRSIFESLVRKKYDNKFDSDIVKAYCSNNKLNDLFKELFEFRNSASHSLKLEKHLDFSIFLDSIAEAITEYFYRDSNINISKIV